MVFRYAAVVVFALSTAVRVQAVTPVWSGAGSYRVLVRADPVNIGARASDEMVAQVAINFASLVGSGQQADLSTLQVHKYDPTTGQPQTFPTFDNAISPYDRPCRFDDTAVPTSYPDHLGYASDYANGQPPITLRPRGGRLFNREMDNTLPGQVVWTHTQIGNQPSYYAIYWKVQSSGVSTGMSPSPWIGDVDLYRLQSGQSLFGLSNLSASVGDLNGDGLFDLIGGAEKGDTMWFPNHGTPGNPIFRGCKMIMDTSGPVDLGWYSSPFIYDWDADGLNDLIIGTSHNVILWWKNTGSATNPLFTYKGFVQADGAKLQVPQSPVPEDTSNSFPVDYYNQPWVGDWNGDGLPDILTGGYTTGRIYYYQCTGRGAGNVPNLHFVGTVNADGQPIDTIWAAAPAAADVDGDGKLELFTGSWPAFQPSYNPDDYLEYFRNLGTQASPNYTRVAFPKNGAFPSAFIDRPSIVDWNNDGKLDIVTSEGGSDMRVFLNDGTPTTPHWSMNYQTLTSSWGFVPVPSFMSVADLDHNGQQAQLAGTTVYTMQGSIHSPHVVVKGTVIANGGPINHPGPGYGDPYNWNIFADWDKDGKIDILFGTQQGNVYFHKNLGAADNLTYADGIKLTLTNGQDLKVGPPVYSDPSQVPDFTALQGSRIIMAVADFDHDGIDDLAVTETYGNIWIFRNTVTGGTSTLAPGVIVKTGPRLDGLDIIDYNNDNKPDLITVLTIDNPGSIYPNQSSGTGNFSFGSAIQPFGLPFCFWGPIFHSIDYNGDGDADFLIRAEFYYFWAERSFIDHGYIQATGASAGGWTSTFDNDADGVVYINHSTARDMIGAASGGKLPITVYNAATSANYNRAGRPLGSTLTYQNTFGALYNFSWSNLYQGDEQQGFGSVEFAGFVADSGGQMFSQMLGTLLQHKKSAGNYYLKLGVMTGVGATNGFLADPASWINLGPNANGTTYQLSLEYAGSTKTMTVALKDVNGTTLRSMSAVLTTLVPTATLAQLALTHLGWSDYSGGVGAFTATNIPFLWMVDSLNYHSSAPIGLETQTGACCLTATGVCLDNVTSEVCGEQSGTFDGVGTTCAAVPCHSTCPIPFADADRDGDVDMSDFAIFQLCYTGTDDPGHIFNAASCGCFDRGSDNPGDGDIDANDLIKFLGCMNGADRPPIPNCN